MLVLSRHVDERIMIGNDIVITILEIHHDHVRIGIDAPRSVDVHREEVYRLVQAANISAVSSEDSSLDSLKNLTLEPKEVKDAKTLAPKNIAQLKKPSKPKADS